MGDLKRYTIMKQKYIIRSVIIIMSFFATFVFSLVISLLFLESDPFDMCYDASNEVEKNPTLKTVTKFMNHGTDGEVSYLHLALFGKLLANHPSIFKEVYYSEASEKHSYFQDLSILGERIFEYYPELKPSNFDKVYAEIKWLKKVNEN